MRPTDETPSCQLQLFLYVGMMHSDFLPQSCLVEVSSTWMTLAQQVLAGVVEPVLQL